MVSKIVLKCDDLSGSPSWHTPWRGRTLDHGRPCWDGSHSPVLHWLSRTTPVRRQQVYRSTQHRWLQLSLLQPPLHIAQTDSVLTRPDLANTEHRFYHRSLLMILGGGEQVTGLPLCDWTSGLVTCYPTLDHIIQRAIQPASRLSNLIFSLSAPLY